MNISIFGLGYVGAVSCASFSKLKHNVVGVDISQVKVNLINEGKSPIIEKDLDEYIELGISNKLLSATTDLNFAIENSDLSIICVGTPSNKNGSLKLDYVYNVCKEIAKKIRLKKTYHSITAIVISCSLANQLTS